MTMIKFAVVTEYGLLLLSQHDIFTVGNVGWN